jgi:hypothetical protein
LCLEVAACEYVAVDHLDLKIDAVVVFSQIAEDAEAPKFVQQNSI